MSGIRPLALPAFQEAGNTELLTFASKINSGGTENLGSAFLVTNHHSPIPKASVATLHWQHAQNGRLPVTVNWGNSKPIEFNAQGAGSVPNASRKLLPLWEQQHIRHPKGKTFTLQDGTQVSRVHLSSAPEFIGDDPLGISHYIVRYTTSDGDALHFQQQQK